LVKFINNLHKKEEKVKEKPTTLENIELLKEIRDSLKK